MDNKENHSGIYLLPNLFTTASLFTAFYAIVASMQARYEVAAIAIFIGRFRRFNSWDLITQPDILLVSTMDDLTTKKPLLIMLITFIILTTLYWLTKQITLGTILRIKQLSSGLSIIN